MSFRVTNMAQSLQAMSYFPETIRRKWLRIALNASGGLLRRRLVDRLPRKSGLLRSSIGVKVNFLKSRPGEWHTTVGARRRFRRSQPQIVPGLGLQVSKRGRVRAATKSQLRQAKASMFGQKKEAVFASRYVHVAGPQRHGEIAFARVQQDSGPEALHAAHGKLLQGIEAERQKALAMSQ